MKDKEGIQIFAFSRFKSVELEHLCRPSGLKAGKGTEVNIIIH